MSNNHALGKCLTAAVVLGVLTGGVINSVHASEPLHSYELKKIVVESDRERSYYPGKMVVRESAAGPMGNVDFMELPVNALSIGQKSIESNKFPGNTLARVATLDPGVVDKGNKTYNDLLIRGYRINGHDYLIDGISGMSSMSSVSMNFADSVEIISGPSVLFNGITPYGSIGGTVNIVPKKAEEKDKIVFSETFSGKSNLQHALDVSHRFGKNDAWGVRVNADYQDGNTELKHEKMRSKNFFVDVDHDGPEGKTNLLYGYKYVHQQAPNLYVSIGGLPQGEMPIAPDGDTNFQYSWGLYEYSEQILTLKHEGEINKDWKWYVQGGYHDNSWDHCRETWNLGLTDVNGDYKAWAEDLPIAIYRKSIGAGVRGEVETGSLKHNISLNVDKLWSQSGGQDWFADDPHVGNMYDDSISKFPMPAIEFGPWQKRGKEAYAGATLIDRMVTDDDAWTFLAGVRHQRVEVKSKHDGNAYTYKAKNSKTSPSFGIMHKFTPKLAMYGNYMQGLSKGRIVRSKYANANEFMAPKETEQYEVGMKWDNNNIAATLAAFQIEQEGEGIIGHDDKVHKDIWGYTGHQRNRGIQFTVFGQPTEKLSLIGGVMYLDPEFTSGKDADKDVKGIAKWNSSLFAEYDFNDAFAMNTRLRMSDSTLVGNGRIGGYTTVDLGAEYKFNMGDSKVRLSADVFNIFDKNYWYAYSGSALALGNGRTAVVTAEFEF